MLGPVQNSNIAAKTTPGTPNPCTNDTWYTSTRSTRRVWTTPARFGSRSLASGSACSHGSTRSAPACPSVPAIERSKNRLEGVARNASVNLARCHFFLNFDVGAGASSFLSPPSPFSSRAAGRLKPWVSARRSAGAVWIDAHTP